MNDQQIDDAVREMARRWYFNGSLDGGLGRDTDEAEKRHVDIHATIKQMALFGTALASRVRAAEQERCYMQFIEERGVSTPCARCQGMGVRAYGSSATWHGGVGGQTVTSDVCDRCWGSGDDKKRWPSHREIAAAIRAPRPEEPQ